MRYDKFIGKYIWRDDVKDLVKCMVGDTFDKVKTSVDEMVFENDDVSITFYHEQDCCESVRIEDICGDIADLVSSPILSASIETNDTDATGIDWPESFLWTFYKFATIKGYVTVRWLGESNGYYSEEVDVIVKKKETNNE